LRTCACSPPLAAAAISAPRLRHMRRPDYGFSSRRERKVSERERVEGGQREEEEATSSALA
jgi:hypothetical protein